MYKERSLIVYLKSIGAEPTQTMRGYWGRTPRGNYYYITAKTGTNWMDFSVYGWDNEKMEFFEILNKHKRLNEIQDLITNKY